jgi:general secretion pathway protein N
MARREVMRTVTIGMMLLTLSAQGASALRSAGSSDAPDGDLADDALIAVPAGAPATPTPAAAPRPTVLPSAAPASERALSANPLWAVPLSQLPGTRERPIFSSSRRPVPAALATQPVVVKVAPAPKKSEPERPPLSLVGTIAGGDEGFGIFLDPSTKAAVRLKLGDDYQGWKLRLIQGREVTMEKDQLAAVLSMPKPGTASAGDVRLLPAGSASSGRSLPATLRRLLINPVAEHFR